MNIYNIHTHIHTHTHLLVAEVEGVEAEVGWRDDI